MASRTSFAIHLQATLVRFAPDNNVNFAGVNELKSSFLCYVISLF